MNTYFRAEHAGAFSIGLVTAVAFARISGWWLDSGAGVATTMAALFAAGFLVSRWRVERRRERAIALWAGSVAGIAIQLFAGGPGPIWPLVLVVGAFLAAAAVFGAAAVASMFG